MDRSRRQGTNGGRADTGPPASSRLTVRKHKNRRRQGSVWSRLPKPYTIADACGRAVRRSLPALAAVAAIGATGGGLVAGHRWLTSSPRFAITEIAVRGTHHVDPDELRSELPVHIGDNVFVDLASVTRAVRSQPWIASAEVRRVLPHTITIDVREHAAAAVLDLDGERYLIDPDGVPFKRAGGLLETDGLPLITGITRAGFLADPTATALTARAAISAVLRWRTGARPAIDEVHLDAHGSVTLRTRAGEPPALTTGIIDDAPTLADDAIAIVTAAPSTPTRPQIAIQLGSIGTELPTRLRTFDAAWAGLTADERARTRAIHLGVRSDHVTVAFAKD